MIQFTICPHAVDLTVRRCALCDEATTLLAAQDEIVKLRLAAHEQSSRLDAAVADRDQWKGRADQLSEERDALHDENGTALRAIERMQETIDDTESRLGDCLKLLDECYEALKQHRPLFDVLQIPRPMPGDLCSGPYRHRLDEFEKQQAVLAALRHVEQFKAGDVERL